MSLVRIHVRIVTDVEWFLELEKPSGHLLKRYADTLGWNMKLAIEPVVGQI